MYSTTRKRDMVYTECMCVGKDDGRCDGSWLRDGLPVLKVTQSEGQPAWHIVILICRKPLGLLKWYLCISVIISDSILSL